MEILVAVAISEIWFTWSLRSCRSSTELSDVGAYIPVMNRPLRHPCLGSCKPATLGDVEYILAPP